MKSRGDLDFSLITSHCRCLERFPNRKSALCEKCLLTSLPYLHIHNSRVKIINNASGMIRKFVDILRGFVFLRKSRDCDLIHFQQSSSFSFGFVPLIPIILLSSKKKIITLHSTDGIQGIFKFLFRLYNRVDRIIVHSEDMKMHLIKNGVAEKRITKVYHGVKIPHLLGLERVEITFLGAPVERKGILTILDALKILKSRNLTLQVSIYGLYSDSERREAEWQADSRGVKESLVWGGSLTETDFDKKLQQSLFTFAVYSSPVSGSSVVTRAMSNATPVIISDVGGLKEYLDGGGIIITPNDPEELADAIELLIKNPVIRNKLGMKGRERALSSFSWKKIAEQTAAIYASVFSEIPNKRI
jgi:glycosyltransferase involved in cell wall biosynthesis